MYTWDENCVSWKSQQQPIVSLSSTEAEYIDAAEACKEATWLKGILGEIKNKEYIPTLFMDSQSALHLCKDPIYHERTKHIEIDCHVTRERIKMGLIKLLHVSTDDQVADIFTKPLHRRRVHYLLGKLGIIDIYSPTCGRLSDEKQKLNHGLKHEEEGDELSDAEDDELSDQVVNM